MVAPYHLLSRRSVPVLHSSHSIKKKRSVSFDDDGAEKGLPLPQTPTPAQPCKLSPTHLAATSNFETARAIAGILTCSWKSIHTTGLGSRSPDPLGSLVPVRSWQSARWQRLAEFSVQLGGCVRVQSLADSAFAGARRHVVRWDIDTQNVGCKSGRTPPT
ncbi:hypothetical protein EJ07DRAFT_158106 [Lizonia empirigonia]|nr:hypothetical protein EJ07DRAFT_158106 [Lizonia empirigonia]